MFFLTCLTTVLLGFFVTTLPLSSTNQGNKKQSEDKVAILVPVEPIKPYQHINDPKKFTILEWPKDRLREDVADTILQFDQIKNMVSRHYTLRPNEPMYKNDFCDNDIHSVTARSIGSAEVVFLITLPAKQFPEGHFKTHDLIDIAIPLDPKNRLSDGNSEEAIRCVEVVSFARQELKVKLTRHEALVLKYLASQEGLRITRYQPGISNETSKTLLQEKK